MRSRLLSIALVCVFTHSADAQLPSDRYSPLNYVGRVFGFGYSDGYHACKDEKCSKPTVSKHWESISPRLTYPASPPSRTIVARPVIDSPSYAREYGVPQIITSGEMAPMQMQSLQPPIQYQVPTEQPGNAVPKSTIETVPPAAIPEKPLSQPSPSDLRNSEPTTPTRFEALPQPPSVPSVKMPTGTRPSIEPLARPPRN